jgi:hypothetical protein
VNDLWDAFARYVYLPRLRDLATLGRTVAQGPSGLTWAHHGFAVADAYDPPSGRFAGLVTGAQPNHVTGTSLVVRPDLASAQEAHETATAAPAAPQSTGEGLFATASEGSGTLFPTPVEDDRLRRFYAVANLDPERSQRDFSKIAQEIVTNLAGLLGTDVTITVEITAKNLAGFPESVVRTVEENDRTLKFERAMFETD